MKLLNIYSNIISNFKVIKKGSKMLCLLHHYLLPCLYIYSEQCVGIFIRQPSLK